MKAGETWVLKVLGEEVTRDILSINETSVHLGWKDKQPMGISFYEFPREQFYDIHDVIAIRKVI